VPEGDTIFRAARTLQRALAGQVVTRFESVLPKLTRVEFDSGVAGRTVDKSGSQREMDVDAFFRRLDPLKSHVDER